MKIVILSFIIGSASMLSNCKKTSEGSIGYLHTVFDKDGYAINDAKRSLQMIADDRDGSFALMRNGSVLFTFNADFSKDNEEFWQSSTSTHDSIRLGAVINDHLIDGIPEDIILIGDPKFKGKFKLATYIIDNNGVPIAKIINISGKVHSVTVFNGK
jgi:hypothetical protein